MQKTTIRKILYLSNHDHRSTLFIEHYIFESDKHPLSRYNQSLRDSPTVLLSRNKRELSKVEIRFIVMEGYMIFYFSYYYAFKGF